MSSLPTILYKVPGTHWSDVRVVGKLVKYDYVGVQTEEKLAQLLSEGWKHSIAEAAGVGVVVEKKVEEAPEVVTDTPKAVITKFFESPEQPARSEIETMADKLGLKYDGRTSDKKLLQLIYDAQ